MSDLPLSPIGIETGLETEMPSNWQQIDSVKQLVSDQLQDFANLAPGMVDGRLQRLATWFREEAPWEEALLHPEILSIAIPILQEGHSLATSEQKLPPAEEVAPPFQLSDNQRDHPKQNSDRVSLAINQGVVRLAMFEFFPGWQITQKLIYPMVIGSCVWIFWLYACFGVLPTLEDIYLEMGGELPPLTLYVFSSARLVQDHWYALAPIPLIYFIFFAYVASLRRGNPFEMGGWIDEKAQGNRSRLAKWAWHLSLLLELKIEQPTAIMIAGYATPLGWLREKSLNWHRQVNIPQLPPQTVEFDSELPPPPTPTQFTNKRKFSLLDFAISLPQSDYKIELLREIAIYYWEADRLLNEWWIGLILGILNVCFLFIVMVVLLAVMAPIFSLPFF